MSAESYILAALRGLGPKPADHAKQSEKKRYSERLSAALAAAVAAELRDRGMADARPSPPGEVGVSGAERRMAGGIGAKKVDVTWATEESGLLFAASIKCINFRDSKTKNFQKNLTNRRGDMLFEGVTLHRRFPYAVLVGLFFLDKEADLDGTKTRKSTFLNAHDRLRLFTGRQDPAGRDEQYERLYIVLVDANPFTPDARFYLAGQRAPEEMVSAADIFDEVIQVVAERNPDFYEAFDHKLRSVR